MRIIYQKGFIIKNGFLKGLIKQKILEYFKINLKT